MAGRQNLPERIHIDSIFIPDAFALEQNQPFRGQEGNRRAIHVTVTDNVPQIVEAEPAHSDEDVDGELFNDADGAFLVRKIGRNKFAGKSFAHLAQNGKQTIEIIGPARHENVDIFRGPHKTVERAGNAADCDEIDLSSNERDQ